MSDEQDFLRAVAAYDKRPSKTAAMDTWEMFFGPDARKPVRISQPTREGLRLAVERYRTMKDDRDAAFGGSNPLKALARMVTSTPFKAEAGVFANAAAEVQRNQRLKGIQIAMLDLARMKSDYDAEKTKTLADARLRDANADAKTEDVVEAIKRADLTINFSSSSFFGGDTLNMNGYLNMWVRGANPMDNVDTRERYKAERNAFEQLRYETKFESSSRPLYAALNVGRRIEGSAGAYGCSYFVLKEAVKQRSTFTPSDTFYLSKYKITRKRIDSLRSKLDPTLISELGNHVGKVFRDREKGEPAFNGFVKELYSTLKVKLKANTGENTAAFEDRKRIYTQEMREAFRVEGEEEKVVASYERMDRIVAYLEDRMLKQIAAYARDPTAKNLKLPTYVEAQVHGTIDFASDIEKMIIATWEIEGDDRALANVRTFSTTHAIPVEYINIDSLC